jgi:hypothetical protein
VTALRSRLPGFAHSGAPPHLLPFIGRARVVNLYDTPAYFRDGNRVAPHNLYADGRVLRAEARGASTARDIGFRFGPAPPGGRPAPSFAVSYPAAAFTFRWWTRAHRWLVWMDGTQATDAGGGDLAAATVIIQDTVVRTSRFLEYGFRPPDARSAGSGAAVVLRDGRAWRVRWSRPGPDGGTTYTLPSGARMTFAPGQVGRPHHDELGGSRTLDTVRPHSACRGSSSYAPRSPHRLLKVREPPFGEPPRLSGIPPEAAREWLFCVVPVVVDWSSHVALSREDRAAKVSP